ncbi:LegC family aminotransferase [Bacillus sp. BRMEA1]|uniref:LegC family aminotransferase n=1 Tax=Neobacillus endophyticus TaxID=2738405 RepID=UPI001563EE46|nr:LegC family aminotransferase [Neobacillus endophyticus]NRD79383.1 LegC family aminotransferase [Neobacillus endophyticus]
MNMFIPLSVPNLKGNELKYVSEAIESEWVSTGGEFINKFEKSIADYLGVKSAVACQSGTAGLHLALRVLGVGENDEVIVPTLTFIAAVNPVTYMGANPVFMDCDDSLCMDMEKVKMFCETSCEFVNGNLVNKITGRKVKAILIVHVFGNMANLEVAIDIAQKYNLKVIEDATEALGTYYTEGKYNGKYAGTIGDMGIYSFNGNKIITTGGGGMLVSNDINLLDKAKYLSTQAKDDAVNFIHNDIGYNYRMTNLQAAVGLAQLEQLETFIEIKKRNFHLYKDQIADIMGLTLLNFNTDIRPNYWFYSLYIKAEEYGHNKQELIELLSKNNIQTRPIWGLIHLQKPYQICQTFKIEKALLYSDNILNIPCSSNLSTSDVLRVVTILKKGQKGRD